MEPTTAEIIEILEREYEPYCETDDQKKQNCYRLEDIISAINFYFGVGESKFMKKLWDEEDKLYGQQETET